MVAYLRGKKLFDSKPKKTDRQTAVKNENYSKDSNIQEAYQDFSIACTSDPSKFR